MIPKVIPPLTELTVLVTRPAGQADALCAHIERSGGTALRFPTIAIEPLEAPAAEPSDLVVFVSVNAVTHGKHLLASIGSTRVAAIGKATAASLRDAKIDVDYVPTAGFTSEALLAHPDLKLEPGMRALIVRGEGGRELLRDTFVANELIVQSREVYRRVRPDVDAGARDALEVAWADGGVDVVTLTSVATLENLLAMLSERGRELLRSTAVLVVSERIREAAQGVALEGEIIVAPAADDASIVGTLAQWRTRSRMPMRGQAR
jgi:uroporphyrinogen-III synthase